MTMHNNMNMESIRQHIDLSKKSLILHAIFIASIVTYFVTENQIHSSRRITSNVSDDGRPIIHTFFEKLRGGEDDLVVAWKEEWTLAGFDARVLTLNDAKRHPYFKQMEKVVDPIFAKGYDALCLYRWLAMAASGGGWMSDYDTFPTNFPLDEGKILPNNGKLTSYESHVPSLVSGTAEEWARVAKLLTEAIPRIEDGALKSDMHAFVTLKDEGTHDVEFLEAKLNMREGFPYLKALSYVSARVVDCKVMAGGRALHLAHRYTRESYDEGLFPLYLVNSYDEAIHRRGKAARIFLADWRHQCGGSNADAEDSIHDN